MRLIYQMNSKKGPTTQCRENFSLAETMFVTYTYDNRKRFIGKPVVVLLLRCQ